MSLYSMADINLYKPAYSDVGKLNIYSLIESYMPMLHIFYYSYLSMG
jgi:hypothetical protein